MPLLLEIACFNERSALLAQAAGAKRIELCVNYQLGGLSPTFSMIETLQTALHIPMVVMLRPRPGNFIYSRKEVEGVFEHIEFCKKQGVKGIVFGAITHEGKVDKTLCKEILQLAFPLEMCFHRAIDNCLDIERQIETLIEIGVTRLLTSGAEANAMAGKARIAQWQKRYGSEITIMPGGEVRSSNLPTLMEATGCAEYHSAAIMDDKDLPNLLEIQKMVALLQKN